MDWDVVFNRFETVKTQAKGRHNALFGVLEHCNEVEAAYLKFLYAYMPTSDLADYHGDMYLSMVRQSLAARDALPWGKQIPEEIFLNYVLSYRLNNEDISAFRADFFSELYPRVEGLNLYDAALAVNMWCFEKATYKPTDMRTAAPATLVRNMYGRCGECSVFTVGALRSVCIPARECYTPRWAHCDDNHAWVEVWVDGKWYYLGACEPDPVLGRGWFTHAATRAMLIASQNFTGYSTEQHILKQTEKATVINLTPAYADTRRLTVKVSEDGQPVSGAETQFQLVNYGELTSLFTVDTNENGEASLETGYGDLFVFVTKGGRFTHAAVDLRKTDICEIDFAQAVEWEETNYHFDMIPPLEKRFADVKLAEATEAAYKAQVKESEKIRKAYEATFFNEETAAARAAAYPSHEKDVAELLVNAWGNHPVILSFLDADDELALSDKVQFLKALRKKDLTDTPIAFLYAHLRHAMAYRSQFDDNLFFEAVACPWVTYEMITDYRSFIENFFDDSQTAAFREDPMQIYAYVSEHVKDTPPLEPRGLMTSPAGALQLGMANKLSRHVLFVCICRTLGIPAKIAREDYSVSYYAKRPIGCNKTISEDNRPINGAWFAAEPEKPARNDIKTARVRLTAGEDVLKYYENHTLAVVKDGRYQTLYLDDEKYTADIPVEPGHYRVITSTRRPDGGILANTYHFNVNEDECRDIEVEIRRDDIGKYTQNIELDPPEVLPEEKQVLIWPEEGREPTEHLLNEMLEQTTVYKNLSAAVVFITANGRATEGGTLEKVLRQLPSACVRGDGDALYAYLCETFHLPQEKPLTVVINGKTGVYADAGYHVGAADRLVKIVENIGK